MSLRHQITAVLVPLLLAGIACAGAASTGASDPATSPGGKADDGSSCVPATCEQRCGSLTDGCGGQLDCGACAGEVAALYFPSAEDPIDRVAQPVLRVTEVKCTGNDCITFSYWKQVPCELTGSSTTPLQLACDSRSGRVAADGTFVIAQHGDAPAIWGSIGYGPKLMISGYGGLISTGSLSLAEGDSVLLTKCTGSCAAPRPAWQTSLPTDGRTVFLPVTSMATTDQTAPVNVGAILVPCGDGVWKLIVNDADIAYTAGGAVAADGSFSFHNQEGPEGYDLKDLRVTGHIATGGVIVIDSLEELRELDGGTTIRHAAGQGTMVVEDHISDSDPSC